MAGTQKTKWILDPSHSDMAFKVRHLMISTVRGTFKKFGGTVYTNGLDFSSAEVEIWIDPSSIDTGDDKRDQHLRSAEFFDSDQYKEIKFTAMELTNTGGVNYELTGELRIRDVSKRVKLSVEFGGIVKDPWGNEKAGFSIRGIVNRKDWGLNWNAPVEAGGVLLADEVKIICDAEFTKDNSGEGSREMKAATDEEIAAE